MFRYTYPGDKPYFMGLFLYSVKTNERAARYDSEKEQLIKCQGGQATLLRRGKKRTIRLYAALGEIIL